MLAQSARGFTWRNLATIKPSVALAGAVLLLWSWRAQRSGDPRAFARTRDTLVLALGLLAGLCWWNLGLFHRDHYLHEWDTYHYYIGAKYSPELAYTRLYLCTLVADAEDGAAGSVGRRMVRDLETNRVVPAEGLLADPRRCTDRFSPARWTAFKHDVTYFRDRIGPARWPQLQRDHGFNATPVWLLLGRAVAATGPASPRHVLALALIDPVLLLALWGIVLWGFGWRAACVALLFWGGNFPAYWGWTGGGYLRQDWLFAAVLGFALLRRQHMVLAGFALGVSALLRVFPLVILGGLVLQALWAMWDRRGLTVTPSHRRIALGVALSAIVAVPAATAGAGSWTVWSDFVANSVKHVNTPATNHVGLRTVISYDHEKRVDRMSGVGLEDDSFRIWREARAQLLSQRRPLYLAAVGVFAGLLALAVKGRPEWVAAVLGIGLIPVLTDPSCYYYSIFLAFGFLACRHPGIGIGLTTLAGGTWLFHWLGWPADTQYVGVSVLVLAFVGLALATVWRSGAEEERAP